PVYSIRSGESNWIQHCIVFVHLARFHTSRAASAQAKMWGKPQTMSKNQCILDEAWSLLDI
ncbi:MAG TPA: hypothetical protein VK901_22100, partial [Nitrospiraceae bacterium]|nr:hypothetical protein [Nitrospiraceae bacterium]